MGAEGSDEDYCEELQQAEEDVTLDVCQSSRTCPLPKAGAPAPATDPPCRSNEPSCRLAGQRSMLAWLPSAGAHKSRSSANATKIKRRDNKRQRDVEQAAASPTTPARAAHIEKTTAIRRNKDRRKTKEGEGGRKQPSSLSLLSLPPVLVTSDSSRLLYVRRSGGCCWRGSSLLDISLPHIIPPLYLRRVCR